MSISNELELKSSLRKLEILEGDIQQLALAEPNEALRRSMRVTLGRLINQFKEAVAGIGEACRALGTPVTGGNVSLYNESPSGAVYPTPVIGMIGLVDDISHITRSTFQYDGDAILLLGEMRGELGANTACRVWTNKSNTYFRWKSFSLL